MRNNGIVLDKNLVDVSPSDTALSETQEVVSSSLPTSLEAVIGVFKDNPQMDELMEMIWEDRRAEIEANASQ